MSDKYAEKVCDDVLCKEVRNLTEILASLSNSYRLLVGAAEELNRISLVHRHDAEEAIDRADDLGDIIDDVDSELKKLMKQYLKEVAYKVENQELCHSKASLINSIIQTSSELLED